MTTKNLATKAHNLLLRSRRTTALISLLRLVEQREIYALPKGWAHYADGADGPTFHTRDIETLTRHGLIANEYSAQHHGYLPMVTEFGLQCIAAANANAS